MEIEAIPLGDHQFFVRKQVTHLYGWQDKAIIEKGWQVKPGDVCIDAGCGPGTWTLSALARGAYVVVFDPCLVSLALTTEHVVLNGFQKCIMVPAGLWSSTGTLAFEQNMQVFKPNENYPPFPVTTLDEWLESFPLSKIDHINFDIEAAEVEALKGMQKTIHKFKPKFCIEVHTWLGVQVEDLMAQLAGYAFEGFQLRDQEFFLIATPKPNTEYPGTGNATFYRAS